MMPVVKVTANFNFSNSISPSAIQPLISPSQSADTQPLIDLPVDTLLHPLPPFQPILPYVKSTPSVLTIINCVAFTMFIAAFSFFYIRWRCKRHLPSCRTPQQQTQENMPLTPPSISTDEAMAAQQATNQYCPSMWPIINSCTSATHPERQETEPQSAEFTY